MSTTIKYDRYFWTAISCACLAYGLLVVPNYDDGNYSYQLYNTIGLYNPFYNDFYGQYFHFMKPIILLYALLLSGSDAINYRILALFQASELLLCIRLFYLCALRYASKEAAQAGASVFLYLLVAQWALSPLRPETTVVLCCLATFWLCERFKETRSPVYLVGASAITFLVAIPMHTCGAIPCIYLLLFVLANVQQFSRKSLLVFSLLSCAFAVAGAAILIYPGISSFAGSLALLSLDGCNRFTGLRGEYDRFRAFVRNPDFSPMLIFIAAVLLVSFAYVYKHIRLHSLKQRLNIILFFGAVVIGLGVLPSAIWATYMVYYYLPLVLGFSIAFDSYARRSGSLALLRCALGLSGAFVLWCSFGTMPKLYSILYAGGFWLAALFARRMPAARLTALIVVPMLLYHAVVMVSTKIIFDRAEQKIRETQDVVLAGAWFVIFGENVFSINGKWLGSKTQIIPDAGGAMIEHKSVAEQKAAQINNHRLVRLFGSAGPPIQKSRWNSRRAIGPTFYGLDDIAGNIPAFLDSQEQPLRYVTVKKTPLSSEMLDTYAMSVMRGLTFVEYSCPPPMP